MAISDFIFNKDGSYSFVDSPNVKYGPYKVEKNNNSKSSSSVKTSKNSKSSKAVKTEKYNLRSIGGHGLDSIRRVGMIGITILCISIGVNLNAHFDDRFDNFPQANADHQVLTTEYVDSIDFSPFGSGIVQSLFNTVEDLSVIGKFYRDALDFFTVRYGDINLADYLRAFVSHENATIYFNALSSDDKNTYIGFFTDDIWGMLMSIFYYTPVELMT